MPPGVTATSSWWKRGRYDIGSIVAPVLNAKGEVQLVLRVAQLPKGVEGADVLLVVREFDAGGERRPPVSPRSLTPHFLAATR